MNRQLYKLVLDLFEACNGRRCRHRDRLDQIAEKLQFASDSAVCRIIRKSEPKPHQVRYVARELSQRAVDLHVEEW